MRAKNCLDRAHYWSRALARAIETTYIQLRFAGPSQEAGLVRRYSVRTFVRSKAPRALPLGAVKL